MRKAYKRRNYLINKRFQLAHTGGLIVIQTIAVLVTGLVMSWFYLFLIDPHLVCDHNTGLFRQLAVLLLLLNIGLVVWSIKYTHSIAGPIYKIHNILRNAANGSFPEEPVRLRKGDRFKQLADSVNECLESMQANQRKLDRISALAMARERLETGEMPPEACEELVRRIHDAAKL